jgi:hypothetical protein
LEAVAVAGAGPSPGGGVRAPLLDHAFHHAAVAAERHVVVAHLRVSSRADGTR